jgi:hypothetical protein
LFASVAALLNGKQSNTEFTQAVRDYESKIQATANDVVAGNYPAGGFTCTSNFNGPLIFNLGAPPLGVGTNKGCLFLGKIMTTGTTSTDIFTLAGRQFKQGSPLDIEQLSDALAVAVTSPIDVTENYFHKFGLQIKNVYTITGNTSVGGFGFITEISGAIGGGNPETGSRGVLLYQLNGTISPNTNSRLSNSILINSIVPVRLVLAPGGIRVCLWDGGVHRGEITVGANGSQTATEVTIDNGISVVCQNA